MVEATLIAAVVCIATALLAGFIFIAARIENSVISFAVGFAPIIVLIWYLALLVVTATD